MLETRDLNLPVTKFPAKTFQLNAIEFLLRSFGWRSSSYKKACVPMNPRLLLMLLSIVAIASSYVPAAETIQVLFLGDAGHHAPKARANQLIPVLAKRGIVMDYTEDVSLLQRDQLLRYDGVIVYANIDSIEKQHADALLEYVAGGGGYIPLHCASYCFRDSPALIALAGAQFQKHGGREFSTVVIQPTHPVMQGFHGFTSWDETYIHTNHNSRNRIVLEVRRQGEQAADRTEEPWTWIRTHGNGRVFYTAWGHDERTWGHPGFQNLLERGIRWACGGDPGLVPDYQDAETFPVPKMTQLADDLAPFEYETVGPKIPNYLAGQQWGTQGEEITQMQKPLSPKDSLQHYVTPQDFHLELFVAEPDIQGKPIAMNWDHQGRLWLCETVDYPNELMPPESGRDRIRICEDTDGDWRADRFTVFAENLSIPTSLEFYRGGVIVQAGTETLLLLDTDGDDRADFRKVLISGWAMGDTHGGVSNFQYGLDNSYWAMQGYNDSQPKYDGGEHPGFRQGPFRFFVSGDPAQTQVDQVEFVRSTTNNSWGLGISEEGLIFASTANRAPSFFVPIPNRYYERVRGWTPKSLVANDIAPDHLFAPITKKVRQVDHHGGYTAGAGHAIYTARRYPKAWWNRTAFVCGPTGHLVGTFVLKPDGASFKSNNTFNLMASDDEWSAPIMAEVGPDGNVWVIDWYNYIVQHNPTPKGFEKGQGNAYKSDLRDKTRGRIYRLVYDTPDEPEKTRPIAVDPSSLESLLEHLGNSNRLWRRHAQRLLVERGNTDVVPELIRFVADQTVDAIGCNPRAIHALWTMKGLGALNDTNGPGFQAVVQALRHPSDGVRRNAALVLPPHAKSVSALLGSNNLHDAQAQVQTAALLALADMPPSSDAGKALAGLLLPPIQSRNPSLISDPVLADAHVCAAAAHSGDFLQTLLANPTEYAGERMAPIVEIVAEHWARSDMQAAELERLLVQQAQTNSPLGTALFKGLVAGGDSHEIKISDRGTAAMLTILESSPNSDLGPLIQFATKLGNQELANYRQRLAESLMREILDETAPVAERTAAAHELVRLSDSSTTTRDLLDSITPQTPPELSRGIIRSLASSPTDKIAEQLVERWPGMTPGMRADAMVVMLARPKFTADLLVAIADQKIAIEELSLEQRQTLVSHPDASTRREANRLMQTSGKTIDRDRQAVIEGYSVATTTRGDSQEGQRLFAKNCALCHKHSGEGVEIGPDLTGMAVHPKEELLIHILDPSRSVEGNFRRYTVLTLNGKVMTGMLAAESLSSIVLIDAEGKRHSISREDIDRIQASKQSMMPEGFEQQFSLEAMGDLLEFLTTRGKFVALPLSKVATVVSTNGMFGNGNQGPDRMIFDNWGPKEFNGVPFQLIDPKDGRRANMILLHGPNGKLPPRMPKQVSIPCNMPIKNVHLLSGVSGWGFPFGTAGSTSMIVRFRYEDGQTEDHALLNGQHFADYIRRVDVPKSQFAFPLRSQQIRYLSVQPSRREPVLSIEFIKGDDMSAPMVLAVTAEGLE